MVSLLSPNISRQVRPSLLPLPPSVYHPSLYFFHLALCDLQPLADFLGFISIFRMCPLVKSVLIVNEKKNKKEEKKGGHDDIYSNNIQVCIPIFHSISAGQFTVPNYS